MPPLVSDHKNKSYASRSIRIEAVPFGCSIPRIIDFFSQWGTVSGVASRGTSVIVHFTHIGHAGRAFQQATPHGLLKLGFPLKMSYYDEGHGPQSRSAEARAAWFSPNDMTPHPPGIGAQCQASSSRTKEPPTAPRSMVRAVSPPTIQRRAQAQSVFPRLDSDSYRPVYRQTGTVEVDTPLAGASTSEDDQKPSQPPRTGSTQMYLRSLTDDNSSVTSNERMLKCADCKGKASIARPLTTCDTCPRRYHPLCGSPPPSSLGQNEKFVCGRCRRKAVANSHEPATRTALSSQGPHRSHEPAIGISTSDRALQSEGKQDRSEILAKRPLWPSMEQAAGIAARYRTLTCSFWSRTGLCSHGQECIFMHSETGRYTPESGKVAKDFTCPWWQNSLPCETDICRFSHHDTGLYVDHGKASLRHITCAFWFRRGWCEKSDKACNYAHADTGIYAPAPKGPRRHTTCAFWRETGRCIRTDDECLHAHTDTGVYIIEPSANVRSSLGTGSGVLPPRGSLLHRDAAERDSDGIGNSSQQIYPPSIDARPGSVTPQSSTWNLDGAAEQAEQASGRLAQYSQYFRKEALVEQAGSDRQGPRSVSSTEPLVEKDGTAKEYPSEKIRVEGDPLNKTLRETNCNYGFQPHISQSESATFDARATDPRLSAAENQDIANMPTTSSQGELTNPVCLDPRLHRIVHERKHTSDPAKGCLTYPSRADEIEENHAPAGVAETLAPAARLSQVAKGLNMCKGCSKKLMSRKDEYCMACKQLRDLIPDDGPPLMESGGQPASVSAMQVLEESASMAKDPDAVPSEGKHPRTDASGNVFIPNKRPKLWILPPKGSRDLQRPTQQKRRAPTMQEMAEEARQQNEAARRAAINQRESNDEVDVRPSPIEMGQGMGSNKEHQSRSGNQKEERSEATIASAEEGYMPAYRFLAFSTPVEGSAKPPTTSPEARVQYGGALPKDTPSADKGQHHDFKLAKSMPIRFSPSTFEGGRAGRSVESSIGERLPSQVTSSPGNAISEPSTGEAMTRLAATVPEAHTSNMEAPQMLKGPASAVSQTQESCMTESFQSPMNDGNFQPASASKPRAQQSAQESSGTKPKKLSTNHARVPPPTTAGEPSGSGKIGSMNACTQVGAEKVMANPPSTATLAVSAESPQQSKKSRVGRKSQGNGLWPQLKRSRSDAGLWDDVSDDAEVETLNLGPNAPEMGTNPNISKDDFVFTFAPRRESRERLPEPTTKYTRPGTNERIPKKQLWKNLLAHQCRNKKRECGNAHFRMSNSQPLRKVTTTVEVEELYGQEDIQGHKLEIYSIPTRTQQQVEMPFTEFMGMPEEPVVVRAGDGGLEFKDAKREKERNLAAAARRSTRRMGCERWPFIDGGD